MLSEALFDVFVWVLSCVMGAHCDLMNEKGFPKNAEVSEIAKMMIQLYVAGGPLSDMLRLLLS